MYCVRLHSSNQSDSTIDHCAVLLRSWFIYPVRSQFLQRPHTAVTYHGHYQSSTYRQTRLHASSSKESSNLSILPQSAANYTQRTTRWTGCTPLLYHFCKLGRQTSQIILSYLSSRHYRIIQWVQHTMSGPFHFLYSVLSRTILSIFRAHHHWLKEYYFSSFPRRAIQSAPSVCTHSAQQSLDSRENQAKYSSVRSWSIRTRSGSDYNDYWWLHDLHRKISEFWHSAQRIQWLQET